MKYIIAAVFVVFIAIAVADPDICNELGCQCKNTTLQCQCYGEDFPWMREIRYLPEKIDTFVVTNCVGMEVPPRFFRNTNVRTVRFQNILQLQLSPLSFARAEDNKYNEISFDTVKFATDLTGALFSRISVGSIKFNKTQIRNVNGGVFDNSEVDELSFNHCDIEAFAASSVPKIIKKFRVVDSSVTTLRTLSIVMQPNSSQSLVEFRNNAINFIQEGAFSFGRNTQLKSNIFKFDKFIFVNNKVALISYDALSTVSDHPFTSVEFKQNEILGFRRQREAYPTNASADAKAYQISGNKFACNLRFCQQYSKLYVPLKPAAVNKAYTHLYAKLLDDSSCMSPIGFVGRKMADLRLTSAQQCLNHFKESQSIKDGQTSVAESDLYKKFQFVFA